MAAAGIGWPACGVPPKLAEMVEKARRDWLMAQNEFNAVTEPELVDHAIFAMYAAERRYVYLLRLAREAQAKGSAGGPSATDSATGTG